MDQNYGLKERIKTRAAELGIDALGFAGAEDFTREKAWLQERVQVGRASPFEEQDLEQRCSPAAVLPGAQTLLSAAVAYPSPRELPPPRDGQLRGRVSSHSWGQDYHLVLTHKLHRLAGFIEQEAALPGGGTPTTRVFVDTGPLLDRAVAERAGLGFVGKNTCLITRDFGSWVFLGEIVTTLRLPPDQQLSEDCGDCDLCIRACPTGALNEPYKLDTSRCLAYITQQTGTIQEQYRQPLDGMLYGCDICQNVCPKNRAVNTYREQAFKPEMEEAYPRLLPLFSMSNRDFEQRFGHLAGAWRRLKTWQRNALVVIGNRRDRRAVPELSKLLNHHRLEIRSLAAWALARSEEKGGKDGSD